MEMWMGLVAGVLVTIIIILLVKIYLLRKSAKEIQYALADKLAMDTNTLVDICSRDCCMRELAEDINVQLRLYREQRLRFQQGDMELKEAVTNISHDLRTPLTAISGYLELLEQEETSENAKRYLRIIQNRTQSLKQLTEELFRYSVFMTESETAHKEEVSLHIALEESISACYTLLKKRGITPEIDISENKAMRYLNKNALTRILENIISNAAKYSDGDLQIKLLSTGELTFSNHASELDETRVQQLFDRFYTVETATKSTGLGLSIARMLTEQMGGEIKACYGNGILKIRLWFPK